MATRNEALSFWADRPALSGSFLVVLVLTGVLFASVFPAYLTLNATHQVEMSTTGYALSDDGSELTVTLELTNPLPDDIAIESQSGTWEVGVAVGEERYSTLNGADVEGGTLESGETEQLTLTFVIKEERRDEIRSALDAGEVILIGRLDAAVVDAKTQLEVSGIEVSGGE
ncbi:MAG: hypothetical protein ABEH90_09335 [Halolamina sp.]